MLKIRMLHKIKMFSVNTFEEYIIFAVQWYLVWFYELQH